MKWCRKESRTEWVEFHCLSSREEHLKNICKPEIMQGSALLSPEKLWKDWQVYGSWDSQTKIGEGQGIARKTEKGRIAGQIWGVEEASWDGSCRRNNRVQQVLGWKNARVSTIVWKNGRRHYRSPLEGTSRIWTINRSFSLPRQEGDRRDHKLEKNWGESSQTVKILISSPSAETDPVTLKSRVLKMESRKKR